MEKDPCCKSGSKENKSEEKTTVGDTNKEKVKSYSGIPEAIFIADVDSFMAEAENGENADRVLKRLEEQHGKYKYMEYNLASKRRRLKNQIPDLQRSRDMITMLESLKKKNYDVETQFLLSDQVYVKASIPPTNTVSLWLGANVMLEFTLEDAAVLLEKNIKTATHNLELVEHDLDFLRDQVTTTEVNMARVFNWDVKRRQAVQK